MTRAKRDADSLGPGGDPQRKIAAQRKAPEHQRHAGEQLGDARHGADDFGQAIGMEQVFVEVMARAMIAQVQADDVPALGPHPGGGGQQVRRVAGALPAVNQHGETARGLSIRGLRRMPAVQPHAAAAVQHQAAAGGRERRGPPAQQAAPQRRARQDGLQVRVGDQPRRAEVVIELNRHRDPRCGWRPSRAGARRSRGPPVARA
jgi:hypothetical protein